MAVREITYSQAICESVYRAMERDERVFTYGEDIAKQGGIFGAYKCLIGKFPGRVIDTPISEEVIYGAAVGAALAGTRPVVEYHFADFLFTGMGAVVNQIMKIRYMAGGQGKLPIVLRGPCGIFNCAAAQHSQDPETLFVHIPGIKVVMPATPYDAKGLMATALKSDDPVIVFEHRRLYARKGEVPEEDYEIPFGKADVKRVGRDVTVVTAGVTLWDVLEAADDLSKEGVELEVIDLRSLVPWDRDAVAQSVKKTGRLLVVHEAWKRAGWGAEVAATIQEICFDYLDAPILRVCGANVPAPFSPVLEREVVVNKERIKAAVRRLL